MELSNAHMARVYQIKGRSPLGDVSRMHESPQIQFPEAALGKGILYELMGRVHQRYTEKWTPTSTCFFSRLGW